MSEAPINSTPVPPSRHANRNTLVILAAVIILALLGCAVYLWRHNNSAGSSPANNGWTSYAATKYGFKFQYPSDWGTPAVSESAGTQGKTYGIHFQQSKASSPTISASFDSQNLVVKNCDAQDHSSCSELKAFTSSDVKQNLSQNAKSYTAVTDKSAALVTSGPGPSDVSLMVQQIISLPSLNVTAAKAYYTVNNPPKSCPKDTFSPNGTVNCVSRTNFDDITEFLSSIQKV